MYDRYGYTSTSFSLSPKHSRPRKIITEASPRVGYSRVSRVKASPATLLEVVARGGLGQMPPEGHRDRRAIGGHLRLEEPRTHARREVSRRHARCSCKNGPNAAAVPTKLPKAGPFT